MANNYELKVVKIYCAHNLEDGDKVYQNLITRVEYNWLGTSDSGATGCIGYTKDLDLPGDDYVPFDKLEESNVKNWINDNAERNIAISIIDEQISQIEENKFKETSVPWNVISEPKTNS
jgi:hypothetical protein